MDAIAIIAGRINIFSSCRLQLFGRFG